MNPDLHRLHPYPFEKLARLKAGITPPADKREIVLSIGEPKDPPPAFIAETLAAHLGDLSRYPSTRGLPELREAISSWLKHRFGVSVDPEREILPVAGTREALFSFAQAVIDRSQNPLVLIPNPFYQIYEGAAILAGAEPYYLNATTSGSFLPDFDAVPESLWKRCQLLYLCTPHNPTGGVIPLETLQRLIDKAHRYDFLIASDECYSEIYRETPPPGLLEAAAKMGNDRFSRCIVFHSLSKRSSAPGLRSGFVAGDAEVLERYYRYRTYHGATLPLPAQYASIAAWQDEAHVEENRRRYQRRFEIASEILKVTPPEATFYFWLKTPVDDQAFARELFARENVTVLPGSFLAREARGVNPGKGYVRIAWVYPEDICREAAERITSLLSFL